MRKGPRWTLFPRLSAFLVSAVVSAVGPVIGRCDDRQDRAGPYENAVVAADHPLASEAGVEILRQGGNVVDAAVATAFTLSVVRPYSAGLGGGGFMVIWHADEQQAVALDYRERAPRKAARDMYIDPDDPSQGRDRLSRRGHLAVAVPGEVAGLCHAVEHYGRLDLETVMQPALRLAREGFAVDEHTRKMQKAVLARFSNNPDYRERYKTLYRQYLNGGRPWQPGDRVRSPQLRVLRRIAEKGADGFYEGPVAEALVGEMHRGGGLITEKDLASMQTVVREPVRGEWKSYEILGMPPPSSGGVALLEMLNILSVYEDEHPGHALRQLEHNSPDYVHLLTEAMKHAFADRAEYLGDADFADVPVERLVSRRHAEMLAGRIDIDATKPQDAYGRFAASDDGGTTHFSIVDADGNAVACTETINTLYGSWVVVPEFGVVLNNEMADFSTVPGEPNVFGLIQSEANAVGPRKKPLSSMSPTIVLREGKAVHALGASGGPRIISSTLQVLFNLTLFDMTPAEAVERPRFHHQWVPNELFVEKPLIEDIRKPLHGRGHTVERRNNLSATQAASRTGEGLRGAADPRKHGRAAGY